MIRRMMIKDYNSIITLWQNIDGVGLRSLDDSKEGIEKFLKRNPNTCFCVETDDKIIGTILAGHDGRRGYIYHLAVAHDYRKNGYGKQLVEQAISSLRSEGINKVALVVFNTNDVGNKFWEKLGFEKRDDLSYRNMSINEDNL